MLNLIKYAKKVKLRGKQIARQKISPRRKIIPRFFIRHPENSRKEKNGMPKKKRTKKGSECLSISLPFW